MIEYEPCPEFSIAIDKLLADPSIVEFNPIREHEEIKLSSLLCVRTNADGDHVTGKGKPIICRKMADPLQVLTGSHYLIIADYYFWNHADPKAQEAALYHALMHIQIKEIEKEDGKQLKLGIRKPDVDVYPSEVFRYGAHSIGLLSIRDAFKQSAKQLVQNVSEKT